MDKQEALIEFLKGLRIAINNSQAYSRQHPYFLKSAQDFKEKIEGLLIFLNPIKVSISPDALFLDGKYWDKVVFSRELAQSLHQRKIKSIEFKLGLDVNELADLLSCLSLQPKEIFRSGGVSSLLNKTSARHICVEELDYSGFLGTQGEEAKDVWLHLFKDAVEKKDKQKIDEFADNFFNGVQNLSVKAIIDDDNLRKGLGGFLRYLKDNHTDKFSQCAAEFSRLILGSGSNISGENVDKLKEVFKDFDGNDFADALLSQASDKKSMDALNIGLFSQLAGKERVDKLASSLANQVESKAALKNNPALLKKISDLLSGTDSIDISVTYRNALASLVKNISFKDSFFFDRGQLRVNYRTIILNLLLLEKDQKGLDLILVKLNKEWPDITQDKDYRFLRSLSDMLKAKNQDGDLALEGLGDIEKQIAEIVENSVWLELLPSEELAYLADTLGKSYTSADFYLDKIFLEKKITFYGLKLFLRFFPVELKIFYKRIEEMRSNLELLSCIIEVIARINLKVSLSVLKEIFSFGNELIKIEVLRAMQTSPEFDAEFIFPLIEGKSTILKKEALRALLRNDVTKKKAIDMLLGISSPWGSRNYLILENVRIIEALGLRDARDYLIHFSKKRFFWNRELRDKALGVLEGWK